MLSHIFTDDILRLIFENLPISDLHSSRLVCVQWNKVIQSDLFWKNYHYDSIIRRYEQLFQQNRSDLSTAANGTIPFPPPQRPLTTPREMVLEVLQGHSDEQEIFIDQEAVCLLQSAADYFIEQQFRKVASKNPSDSITTFGDNTLMKAFPPIETDNNNKNDNDNDNDDDDEDSNDDDDDYLPPLVLLTKRLEAGYGRFSYADLVDLHFKYSRLFEYRDSLGRSAIHLIMTYSSHIEWDEFEVILKHIRKSVDLKAFNVQDHFGKTPLMCLVHHSWDHGADYSELFSHLLDNHIKETDLFILDKRGWSVYEHSASCLEDQTDYSDNVCGIELPLSNFSFFKRMMLLRNLIPSYAWNEKVTNQLIGDKDHELNADCFRRAVEFRHPDDGTSILHWAIESQAYWDILSWFLDKAAEFEEEFDLNVDIPDNEGWTPLFHAVLAEDEQSIETLLNWKTDVQWNQTETKETPLHVACSIGSIAMSTILLKAGADKKAVDIFGKNPATVAKESGFPQLADFVETFVR